MDYPNTKSDAEKILISWLLQFSLLKWHEFKKQRKLWKQIKRLAASWNIDINKYTF